ncbi:MAG: hypothetical protein CVU46_12575 [Chloroflexi bacterium HGW-Chloroflexi-8]|nr:MAG: hypothetical protein CVU46_12575 [Chloroflexi bacterium HGW-Chloroflexi-8]
MNYTTIIIYVLFIGGGLFLLVMAFLQYFRAKKAATEWQTVQGVVQDSELSIRHARSSSGTSSTQYRPKVTYQFQVNGQSISNDSIAFGDSNMSRNKAEEKLSEYPKGALVMVHYDPADPAKSVLETKANSFVTNLVVGILVLVVGVVLAFILK